MRAATATASASAWTSAWYLFQPWSYSCDQASAWASSAVCIRCALRLPTTDCWLYAVSWVTTGSDGAEAGGCRRGRTTVARTTVHTRTARKSATKPTCSSFRSPYPWGAFRPELGAETCGGTAQVNGGKGESLPDTRRLCVAFSEVVGVSRAGRPAGAWWPPGGPGEGCRSPTGRASHKPPARLP